MPDPSHRGRVQVAYKLVTIILVVVRQIGGLIDFQTAVAVAQLALDIERTRTFVNASSYLSESRLLHRWTIRERMSNEYSMNGKVNKKLKKNNVGMGLVSSLEMSYAEVVRAPSLSENYASWIKAGNNDVLVLAGTGSIHIGVHV